MKNLTFIDIKNKECNKKVKKFYISVFIKNSKKA